MLLPYFDNKLSRLEQVFLADYNGKLLYNFNPINSQIIQNFDMDLHAPLLNDNLISLAPHMEKSSKYDEIIHRIISFGDEFRVQS